MGLRFPSTGGSDTGFLLFVLDVTSLKMSKTFA
jgi:hypothetical protein